MDERINTPRIQTIPTHVNQSLIAKPFFFYVKRQRLKEKGAVKMCSRGIVCILRQCFSFDLSGVAATNLQRGKENSSGSTVKMASLFVTPLK